MAREVLSILLISNYSRKSNGGGIKTFVENLADQLYSINGSVYLIARYGEPAGAHEKIINGNTPAFIVRAIRECFRIKPSLIHTHANWYCILPAVIYRIFRKVKIVHTLHSIPEKNTGRLQSVFFGWLLKQCDHVTFVSEFLRKYYCAASGVNFDHSQVIYPGADHANFNFSHAGNADFLRRYSIGTGSFIILAHGLTSHYLKYSGAVILLEAFSKLLAEFPGMVLIITKEGKYDAQLKDKVAELHINHAVVFTGTLENPASANAVADIYAHITLAEGGASLAVLEAMHCRNPIVATRVGGIPEVLTNGRNAVLVEPDADAVYEALRRLITNHEARIFLADNAFNDQLQLTWKTTAEKFITLFTSMLHGKP